MNLFVRFLEESEDTKKSFRNYLTFSVVSIQERFIIKSGLWWRVYGMFIVFGVYNFACEHKSTDVSIHSTIKESWVHSDTNVCLPLDESKSRSFVATSKYFCPCDLSIMIRTVKSRVLTPVTNSKVNFLPKGKVRKHQKSPL